MCPLDVKSDEWCVERKLINHELRELSAAVKKNTEVMTDLRVAVGKLQVKASLWGALGGLLTGGTALVFMLLRS